MDQPNSSLKENPFIRDKCPTAFVVELEGVANIKRKPNFRPFDRNEVPSQRKSLTKEDLAKKQDAALQRKQNLQKAKIARIHERSEDCRKVDEKVQILLEQDALRRQLPGSETIKPLSRAQVTKTIREVAKDMENMSLKNKDIVKDL